MDKGKERGGELVITGGHTAMFLERTEVVLHAMTMPVVPFVEGTSFVAPGGCGQTREDAQFIQLNAERVGAMFWRAIGRPPSAGEQKESEALLETLRAEHRTAPDAEQQAWRDFGHSLFDLKEFIYIR